jgi:predicted O-methyltransferase YrrM
MTRVGAYEFSVDWFAPFEPIWLQMFAQMVPVPKRILEIGSYEGRSATWLIKHAFTPNFPAALYCVDTWEGGIEHNAAAMPDVESRFDRNIAMARAAHPWVEVVKLKGISKLVMAGLLSQGHQTSFDFIYIDGSHQAADVLSDLVIAFDLCRVGGLIACDDYLWQFSEKNPLLMPKLGIDAFVNCFGDKVSVVRGMPLAQLWLKKVAR